MIYTKPAPKIAGHALTGPNPVDRGKNGSKIHMITERTGLPISVAISAANVHDSLAVELLGGAGHPADPLPARTASPSPGQAPRRQGLRLSPRAPIPTATRHHPAHRPPHRGLQPAIGPPPIGDRTHDGLAERMPPVTPPLRAPSRPLRILRRHHGRPHLLPEDSPNETSSNTATALT